MRIVTYVLVGLIQAYRVLISPVLPASCRYLPSCSHYAGEALLRHGTLRGAWLAIGRIMRCHPWGGEGYDPVPEHLGMARRVDFKVGTPGRDRHGEDPVHSRS